MKKWNHINALAVDILTGEAIGKIVRIKQKRLRREKGFYMGDQSLSATLAKDKELRGQPMSVLLYMLSKVEDGNVIKVSQKKISEELEIHRVRVSAAIKKLLQKQIIIKDKDSDVIGVYILNPEYFWKGEREKSQKNFRK